MASAGGPLCMEAALDFGRDPWQEEGWYRTLGAGGRAKVTAAQQGALWSACCEPPRVRPLEDSAEWVEPSERAETARAAQADPAGARAEGGDARGPGGSHEAGARSGGRGHSCPRTGGSSGASGEAAPRVVGS